MAEVVDASHELKPVLLVGAPLAVEGGCSTAPSSSIAAASSASCRRPICPTTASSTRSGSSPRRRDRQSRPVSDFRASTCRSAPICCSPRRTVPDFVLHVEICEDLWVPMPPSTLAALAGATVLANLSASNITVGKAEYRRLLCAQPVGQMRGRLSLFRRRVRANRPPISPGTASARSMRTASCLAETRALRRWSAQLITADIDLERLRQERMRMTSFADSARARPRPRRGLPPRRVRLRRCRRARFRSQRRGRALSLRAR